MTSGLIFADGVRLTAKEEIPGPSNRREELWARVGRANIQPGYTLKTSNSAQFRYYAEANVHAPDIWEAFAGLARAILGERGSLLLSFKDDEPAHIVEAPVQSILTALAAHTDQLVHDGYIQFGIIAQTETTISEVLVAPTKHFKIWFSDERAFAAQMVARGLVRAERLEFLDEYPHVTTRLPNDRALLANDLESALIGELEGL